MESAVRNILLAGIARLDVERVNYGSGFQQQFTEIRACMVAAAAVPTSEIGREALTRATTGLRTIGQRLEDLRVSETRRWQIGSILEACRDSAGVLQMSV